MVKICPSCKYENPDDAFWCVNCKKKLISVVAKIEDKNEDITPEEQSNEKIDYDYEIVPLDKAHSFSFLKIPFLMIIICSIVFSTYYIATNLQTNNFNWDAYGGNPFEDSKVLWDNNELPWTEQLKIENMIEPFDSSYTFSDIGLFGEDYWFSGNKIITSDDWNFEYTKVKDCNFKAVVLNYYVYNKDGKYYYPSEIFSPLDIFFGHDDIVDNLGDYKYSILNNFYRMVQWQCHSDNYLYFQGHVTNTHLIAHNTDVLDNMKNIQIGDVISLTGSYINLVGSHPSEKTTYTWTTDDTIGNYKCEIILVDSFEIV